MTKKRAKRTPGVSVPRVIVPASTAKSALRLRAARQTDDYGRLVSDISSLLEEARRSAARSVNSILAATYWDVGRRIVEYEQGGKARAEYGKQLLAHLGTDLTTRHGRGFSRQGLQKMRSFYMGWAICPTPSGKFEARAKCPMLSGKFERRKPRTSLAQSPQALAPVHAPIQPPFATAVAFPLSWSQYVRLMSVDNPRARAFYEVEAIRGGWSVRQLDRQISTQFYDRAVRSKRPHALLTHGQVPQPEDILPIEEEVRDPYLLEFLNLKDEYSETDLEVALISHLEWFLLEMGTGFAFVARQKRIRIGNAWYRIDLLLYHRGLRCLVVIDLKTGAFTHADAHQMNLYLNFAKAHLMMPGEAEPVGIILCSDKDDAVVKYATGDILRWAGGVGKEGGARGQQRLRPHRSIISRQRSASASSAASCSNARVRRCFKPLM